MESRTSELNLFYSISLFFFSSSPISFFCSCSLFGTFFVVENVVDYFVYLLNSLFIRRSIFGPNQNFVYFGYLATTLCRWRNRRREENIVFFLWFPRPLISTIHFAHTIPYRVLLFLTTSPNVRRKFSFHIDCPEKSWLLTWRSIRGALQNGEHWCEISTKFFPSLQFDVSNYIVDLVWSIFEHTPFHSDTLPSV